MNRTTIMLPPALHERAAQKAAAKGWSLSQLIRELLERETQETTKDDPLFRDGRTFSGPAGLSSNHDELLYGDEETRALKAGERPPAHRATSPRAKRR